MEEDTRKLLRKGDVKNVKDKMGIWLDLLWTESIVDVPKSIANSN